MQGYFDLFGGVVGVTCKGTLNCLAVLCNHEHVLEWLTDLMAVLGGVLVQFG